MSQVKKTSIKHNKCQITPPKDVFKNIPKVTKPPRRPTPKKKRPVKSKKPPAPPSVKRKRPTHRYTEEDAKKALDEYWET